MKRHIQITGVRKWSGDDLVQLQSESLRAVDGFFAEYGPCIVQGCEITPAAGGSYDIAPGLVVLRGKGIGITADGVEQSDTETTLVVPFAGAEGTSLPLYLTLGCEIRERLYADGKVKPIAADYYAKSSAEAPEDGTPFLILSETKGSPRVLDHWRERLTGEIADGETGFPTGDSVVRAIRGIPTAMRNYYSSAAHLWEQGIWNADDGQAGTSQTHIRLRKPLLFDAPYLTLQNYQPDTVTLWVCFYDAEGDFMGSTREMEPFTGTDRSYIVPETTASVLFCGCLVSGEPIIPRAAESWKFMITAGNRDTDWEPSAEDIRQGIGVGGVNLLPESDFAREDPAHYAASAEDDTAIYTLNWQEGQLHILGLTGGNSAPGEHFLFRATDTLPGEEYILSLTLSASEPAVLYAQLSETGEADYVHVDETPQRVSLRLTPGADPSDAILLWCDRAVTLTLDNAQLEEGNTVTAWALTPEDLPRRLKEELTDGVSEEFGTLRKLAEEVARKAYDDDPRLSDTRVADGGNADTVGHIPPAPTGEIEAETLASYDSSGQLHANGFADRSPVDDSSELASIGYRVDPGTDPRHRFCTPDRFREQITDPHYMQYKGQFAIGGNEEPISTAEFIQWLEEQGFLTQEQQCVRFRGSWAYAFNQYISDTGLGVHIPLAGALITVTGGLPSGTDNRGYSVEIVTATSVSPTGANGGHNETFVYADHGPAYSPGWRRYWNDKNYTSIPAATTAAPGLMSTADKTTLGGLESGDVYAGALQWWTPEGEIAQPLHRIVAQRVNSANAATRLKLLRGSWNLQDDCVRVAGANTVRDARTASAAEANQTFLAFWTGTLEEYNGIATKSDTTLYFIKK